MVDQVQKGYKPPSAHWETIRIQSNMDAVVGENAANLAWGWVVG